MKFHDISRRSCNLKEFLVFVNLEASKPWYSLGIIGVPAMSWISWKFAFPLENQIFMFLYFSTFSKNFNENALFLKKRAHGAQDHPKCIVFHWFKQHSRQPAARVRKHDFLKKVKNLSALSMEKWKFHEDDGNSIEIMIFDMSKHQVFLRKYLTKSKVPVLFRRSSWHSSKM